MEFKVGDIVVKKDRSSYCGFNAGESVEVYYIIGSYFAARSLRNDDIQEGGLWMEDWELVKSSDERNVMKTVKDLFKSKKQKLFEKYVYNGNSGLDWSKYAVQKVFIKAFEKELLEACEELEKEEKEEKKNARNK